MKAFAASLLVLAAGLQPLAFASDFRTQPTICVVLRDSDEPGPSGTSLLSLQPRDGEYAGFIGQTSATYACYCGGVAGAKGPNGSSSVDDSTESSYSVAYTVKANRPGHFILDVECEVQKHNRSAKRITRELIVLDRAPRQANWLKLDDRFATYSYITPTATR